MVCSPDTAAIMPNLYACRSSGRSADANSGYWTNRTMDYHLTSTRPCITLCLSTQSCRSKARCFHVGSRPAGPFLQASNRGRRDCVRLHGRVGPRLAMQAHVPSAQSCRQVTEDYVTGPVYIVMSVQGLQCWFASPWSISASE